MCIVSSGVEVCGDSVFVFSGQCIDRVMRLVVWPGVVGCMTLWGMSYRYINRTHDLSTNLSFGVQ